MKIWIDFSTAPDPLFFRPIIKRLGEQGHTTWLTAREFSETTRIAQHCGLDAEVVGRHGGATVAGKFAAILMRASRLTYRARRERIDLALSFNSYAQAIAALLTGIPLATCMDYEYQPANHLAFRLARRIVVPEGFDAVTLRRQGGSLGKVSYHEGLKEHVTLVDFQPDPLFPAILAGLGVGDADILVTMRPPATWSAYHRFENALFEDVVRHLSAQPHVKIILLSRYSSQADQYRALGLSNLIIPEQVLEGLNLVYWSDLVISAGGSMNREAVVLGTPAYTVFKGRMAGVDRKLIVDGLLGIIGSADDLKHLVPVKKLDRSCPVIGHAVVNQVVDAVLSAA
jgi:predicted glycosyltransferase